MKHLENELFQLNAQIRIVNRYLSDTMIAIANSDDVDHVASLLDEKRYYERELDKLYERQTKLYRELNKYFS